MNGHQVIDVVENIKFIKCLPRTKKIILVDFKQANGVISSNNDEIYHLYGTPNTFEDEKKTVSIQEITFEEYKTLTSQIQSNELLENRVKELEDIIREMYKTLQR
jgi:hypothetical protein